MTVLIISIIGIILMSGCVANTPIDETVNISYVCDPVGMENNNDEFVASAISEIEDYYGDYFDFKSHIYKVKDLDDAKAVSKKAAADGADLYIGTSYAVNNELLHAIDDKSKAVLAMIGSDIPTEKNNVVSVTFRDEESAFLAGYLAAAESKTGVIGYIGGYDSDDTEIFAGFYYGAKYKDPTVVVYDAYTNSYTNSVKGRNAAEELKGKNADVIFVNCGSCALGISELVRGSEVRLILSSQYEISSDEVIASCRQYVKNAAMFVVDEYLNEQLEAASYRHGISYGFVDLKIEDSISREIKDEVALVRSDIRTSKIKVPTEVDGNILSSKDAAKVPEGQ